MASLRAALPITRCTACQRSILDAFARPTYRTTAMPAATRQLSRRPIARSLATSATRRSDVIPQGQQQEVPPPPPAEEQTHTDPEDASLEPTQPKDSTKPWYLQIADQNELDADSANPFAARQQLPPLPSNPPPLLESLLNHLSVTIGLDHLTLLDLRQVEPPPAFGSNLLMLFGTARSEKHLNVSADRLCRWLRTEHKLTPFADGLLGRNELKLKLRRKNRRSKIMSAAGARSEADGGMDDGTRTGWVCVNVGGVKAAAIGEAAAQDEAQTQGFVGFGRRSEGAKVVVQMMTEEKRGELDLENLWQGVLRTSNKRKKAELEGETDVHRPLLLSNDPDARRRHFMAGLARREQVRGFYSSARRWLADDLSSESPRTLSDLDGLAASMPKTREAKSSSDREPGHPVSDATSVTTMEAYLAHLKSLSDSDTITALGFGYADRTTTIFLRDFYSCMPLFPTEAHYMAQLRLHAHALHIQHPGYTKTALYDLLLDMEVSCPTVSYEAFSIALDAILSAPHTLPPRLTDANPTLHPTPFPRKPLVPSAILAFPDENTTVPSQIYPLKPSTSLEDPPPRNGHVAVLHTITLATSVLERLPAHGHPTLPPTFLQNLTIAIAFPRFPPASNLKLKSDALGTLLHHVRQSITLIYSTPSSSYPNTSIPGPIPPSLIVTLLEAHARTSNWQGFWRVWRDMAMRMQARTGEMYAVLFEEVAGTGDEAVCARVVGEFVGEMEREGVEGDGKCVMMDARIAEGVRRCLGVAGTQYGLVWERCGRVLEREAAEAAEATEAGEESVTDAHVKEVKDGEI